MGLGSGAFFRPEAEEERLLAEEERAEPVFRGEAAFGFFCVVAMGSSFRESRPEAGLS